MHPSFDLYPGYLRHFEESFDPRRPYRLSYDLHAQRNYVKWRDKNGKEIVEPQVRKEGSLSLECREPGELSVRHVREWSIWTDTPYSSRQTLDAGIRYRADAAGSLQSFNLSYRTVPVQPPQFYTFSELPSMEKKGKLTGDTLAITGSGTLPGAGYTVTNPLTSLYTLIDTLQAGRVETGRADFLDDLTMFRPGMEIVRLPDSNNEIEGHQHTLTGYALVGPAILPQYFWLDEQSRVLAVIGRNVAYTLTEAINL